jgi:hypothetical protein
MKKTAMGVTVVGAIAIAVATKAEAAPNVDDRTKCDVAVRAFDTKDLVAIRSIGDYIVTIVGRLDEADMKTGHRHLKVQDREMVAAAVGFCRQKPTATIRSQTDDAYDGMRNLFEQLMPDE